MKKEKTKREETAVVHEFISIGEFNERVSHLASKNYELSDSDEKTDVLDEKTSDMSKLMSRKGYVGRGAASSQNPWAKRP